MRIPRYWAREQREVINAQGKKWVLSCCQWSELSLEEAARRARAALEVMAQKVQSNERLGRYNYSDRPLREEIVEEIKNDRGEVEAMITRNSRGELVLNTARAMFIDIDCQPVGLLGRLAAGVLRLFGKKMSTPIECALQRVERWHQDKGEFSMRVYRTKAGLRCLMTNALFHPQDQQAITILESLGSDPLYIKLCKVQECFRARLTPKPYRCGVPNLTVRYPFKDVQEEGRLRSWENFYEQSTANYTACHFLKAFGEGGCHEDLRRILEIHDRYTCKGESFELA